MLVGDDLADVPDEGLAGFPSCPWTTVTVIPVAISSRVGRSVGTVRLRHGA